MEMQHSCGLQHHLLIVIFLIIGLLLSGACISGVKVGEPCDPEFLAWYIGWYCDGDLEHPNEMCCEGVVGAVGINGEGLFGEAVKVPCLCRVAKERSLGVAGLDIHNILRMYPICDGVLPVGPRTAEACQGRV